MKWMHDQQNNYWIYICFHKGEILNNFHVIWVYLNFTHTRCKREQIPDKAKAEVAFEGAVSTKWQSADAANISILGTLSYIGIYQGFLPTWQDMGWK